MYRLIATDLDGTLLDDKGQIPAANIEYIQKAKDNGIIVALCSGRSYISLDRFERKLGLDKRGGYGICFNGGIVYDVCNKEFLSDIRMGLKAALEIESEIKSVLDDPDVGIMIYAGADLYTENANANSHTYAKRSAVVLTPVKTFKNLEVNPTKILLKGTNKSLNHIYKQMSGFVEKRCKMYFTSADLLEFIPLESGKGQGLKVLADKLGISMAETIAVGDQSNDIEMLEAAGLGIAVANAADEVKASAGYILHTDNNAGAIKEVVEKFVLTDSR